MKSKEITVDLQKQPEHTALFMGGISWRESKWGFIHHVPPLGAGLKSCPWLVWWQQLVLSWWGRSIGSANPASLHPGAAPERLWGAEGWETTGIHPGFVEANKLMVQAVNDTPRQRVSEKCLFYFSIVLDESGAEILQERVWRRKEGYTENLGWSPIFKQ